MAGIRVESGTGATRTSRLTTSAFFPGCSKTAPFWSLEPTVSAILGGRNRGMRQNGQNRRAQSRQRETGWIFRERFWGLFRFWLSVRPPKSGPARGAGSEAGRDFRVRFCDIVRCRFLDRFGTLETRQGVFWRGPKQKCRSVGRSVGPSHRIVVRCRFAELGAKQAVIFGCFLGTSCDVNSWTTLKR